MTKLFSDTELCVKCGLCLPHCPTYGKTLDENESPRGRLSLIQAWAAGQLEATPKLLGHVDRCLLCRSCETVCPANVPYGRLVDDFRASTAGKLDKPALAKLRTATVGYVLQSPRLQRWSGPLLRTLTKTGITQVTGFADLADGLPDSFAHDRWQGIHPAIGVETSRVELFLGCTAELADAETVTAAISLLTRLGVCVIIPTGQVCCGGMALHHGDAAEFARMQQQNLGSFDAIGVDAILTLASGCGAVLQDYAAQRFADKVKDISTFLGQHPWPDSARLEPLAAKALVHSPCSLRNVLHSDIHPVHLLRRIPALQVEVLSQQPNCCGAAGTYLLDHPEMAQALRLDLVDKVAADIPDYFVSSNVGCAMHVRAGLKRSGMVNVQVLHPLVLVDRQLRIA